MHVIIESIQGSLRFSWKNADSAGYRKIMKFPQLIIVQQISSNLQNLLESSSETCMWNLSPFVEVKIFMKKWQQCQLYKNYEISTSFQSSPNFIKLTEFIGIIICNMHVKFEFIWRSFRFSWKNADSAGYRKIMKFPHLFKVHQISSNLLNLLESSSETCMWSLNSFGGVKIFMKKWKQCRL